MVVDEMKELSISKKIVNGKLVRIKAKINDDIIEYIQITGDFFLHPEELIMLIEKSLVGININKVSDAIKKILVDNNALLIGCNPDDIQDILVKGVI